MFRLGLIGAALVLTLAAAAADVPAPAPKLWQPADGLAQSPLWPEGLAIGRPETDAAEAVVVGHKLVAGRPYAAIINVSRPTMTIYPAKGRNSGAALLVFPGGGYEALAIDIEGTEICDWATARGITCVVLKYRVPQAWRHKDCNCQRAPAVPFALQDAQRAISLVRQRAPSLGIDPHKIGVIGFSAGGHLVTAISNAATRTYAPVDAADVGSARPDFAIALYPGHLWSGHGTDLYPFDPVAKDAPPTFLLQSEDDPVDDVHNSIAYYLALQAVKVPVELHLYAHGGHAFGLRPTALPISQWPALVERWLHTIGMMATQD